VRLTGCAIKYLIEIPVVGWCAMHPGGAHANYLPR
jgi:hypothetical protein